MKANIATKLMYTVAGLLLCTTAYLYWQQTSLQNAFTEKRLQCDRRLAALMDGYEVETIEAKPQSVANSLLNKVIVAKGSVAEETAEDEKVFRDDKPKLERFDESIDEIVRRKYRFLLTGLDLSDAQKQELLNLLMEREQIALQIYDAEQFGDEVTLDKADIADLKYQLAEIDSRIQELLESDENKEHYALLKDSDSEQKEFNQYTLGINGLFPTNREQQEVVLFAKLRHKQVFEEEIELTGFDMDYPLTEVQREEILGKVQQALNRYKDEFLKDVRPHLDHDNFPMDQYTLLENYTNTEFDELKAKLTEKIDGRGTLVN